MKLLGRSTGGEADPGPVRRVTGSPGAPAGAPGPLPEEADAEGPTPVRTRLQRLSESIERSRRSYSDRDVRKLLQILGMVLVVFGFVCVIVGWWGASHSPYLYEEIPYLISGGLLGVALVIAGGILIRSAWSLRQVEEERRNAVAIVRAVDRLEQVLRSLEGTATDDRPEKELPPWK
jgi:hypothetical protein